MIQFINNEKNIAMLVLLAIAIGAYWSLGTAAKDVVVPIVTGICSFITGYAIGKLPSKENKDGSN